jgi:two-component system response regulator HydG
MKALVVDDKKSVRDFLKRSLSFLGLDAFEVEDGFEAIELVEKEKFDLFFIDVRMPGLDGLQTYREIHRISPEATVVMITGYEVGETLEEAQKEGVYRSIHKPFDFDQIKDIVDNVGKKNIKEL